MKDNHLILMELLKLKKYFELKERIDNIILLDELGDPFWSEFKNKIIDLFNYENEKVKKINVNTLEKIRFLMTILNKEQEFNFQNIPESISNMIYQPRYCNWRKNSSFGKTFNK